MSEIDGYLMRHGKPMDDMEVGEWWRSIDISGVSPSDADGIRGLILKLIEERALHIYCDSQSRNPKTKSLLTKENTIEIAVREFNIDLKEYRKHVRTR